MSVSPKKFMEIYSSTARFLVAISVVKLPNPKGTKEEQLGQERGRIIIACALMFHAIISTTVIGLMERWLDRVPEVEAVGENASVLDSLKKFWERLFPYYPNPQNPDEILFYKKSVKHVVTPLISVILFVVAIIYSKKSYPSPTDDQARKDAYGLMIMTNAATLLSKWVEIGTDDPPRPIPRTPATRVHIALDEYQVDASTAQQAAIARIFRN